MTGAPQVTMSTPSLRTLVGELGLMEPAMRSELRRGFRAAGAKALSRAKSNASWSSRIPAAITVRPMTGSRSAGVFLRVNADRAPHARAYEGISRSSGTRYFRHPVFGRDAWVAESTRPFLTPAIDAARGDTQKAALDAIQAAARAGRFT